MGLFHRFRYHPLIVYLRRLVPHSWVNTLIHFPAGVLANLVYGWPSRKLTVIGVTGTDGKTTTATWLHHLLLRAGFKVALISTVSAKMGKKEIDTGLHVTAPDHFPLQKILKEMANQGFTHVVLEVTSHGLAQYRFWGIKFIGGVITNVAEDHLDYHGTWKDYLKTKAKLFKNTYFAVLNAEDKSFRYLKNMISAKIVSYGLDRGQVNLRKWQAVLPKLSAYNQANLLAGIAVSQQLGVSQSKISQAVKNLPKIRGRMEMIQAKPFLVVVDFAHTPQALEQVLRDLRFRVKRDGRLLAVFGCAGARDKLRRKMGKVAAELADITLITAEDPRTEGVKKISQDIARWAKKGGAREVASKNLNHNHKQVFARIDDREVAIAKAIGLAKKGDVVGVFGKGHEQSMCYGKTEYPWSDQKTIKKILKGR